MERTVTSGFSLKKVKSPEIERFQDFFVFGGGGKDDICRKNLLIPMPGSAQGMQRSHADWLWGCGFLESAQSGKSLCGIGVAGVDPQDFPVKPLCLGGSAGLNAQFCQLGP